MLRENVRLSVCNNEKSLRDPKHLRCIAVTAEWEQSRRFLEFLPASFCIGASFQLLLRVCLILQSFKMVLSANTLDYS